MGCIGAACSCPDWIITLASFGGIIVYALIGTLIYFIVKAFKEDLEWNWIVLFIVLWPLIIVGAIVGAIIYYIVRLISMPIVGADKYDLKDLERKVNTKIEKGDEKVMGYLKEYKPLEKKEVAKVKRKPSKKKKNRR